MRAPVIFCLILAGCGGCPGILTGAVDTEFRTEEATRYIVRPNGNPIVPAQIHETILMVRDALIEYDPNLYTAEEFAIHFRLIDSNTIYYVDHAFPCDVGLCDGQYNGKIKLNYSSCIGETALVHELLHQFEALLGPRDTNDDDHDTPGLFEETSGYDSIEERLKRRQCDWWCRC